MVGRVVLLDTSFVVALENLSDPHHERAKELDRQLFDEGCQSILHWGILLEIGDGYARVGRRAKGCQVTIGESHSQSKAVPLNLEKHFWLRKLGGGFREPPIK